MKKEFRYFFIELLLILFCVPFFLVSVVTASYNPESPLYLEIAPGPFTNPTVIGLKLGTYQIFNPEGAIFNPAFVNTSEVGNNIQLTGLYKTWEGGEPFTKNNLNFKIMSVAYPYSSGGGGTPVLRTIYGGRSPIIDWSGTTITANPFVVELYLVNTNSTNPNQNATLNSNGQFYQLDTPYTVPPGFNPIFSLAMADDANTDVGTYTSSNGDVITSGGSYVDTGGTTGPNNTPILDINSFSSDPDDDNGFFYGDTPLPLTYFFNFLQPTASFNINSAIGTGRVVVNEARIEVQNGVTGENYSQHLSFTDTTTNAAFQLFPREGTGAPISYQLFLGVNPDPIVKGASVLWSSLVSGINSRDLMIGGIEAQNITSLASGTYQGIISVTISNPN